MKSKWFVIDEDKSFNSKKTAITLEEAWEKTLGKWALKMDGYWPISEVKTCGLCDYVGKDMHNSIKCEPNCPVFKITRRIGCEDTPYGMSYNYDIEYLFLLFVKEATK